MSITEEAERLEDLIQTLEGAAREDADLFDNGRAA